MDTRREKLEALKKEKNAVIMAHYYVPDEVQEIADYIGDSYYLSDVATKVDASVIVLCGVRFMGESAKILNPGKKVLLPDLHADCPMAHMAAIEKIEEVRKEYPDVHRGTQGYRARARVRPQFQSTRGCGYPQG